MRRYNRGEGEALFLLFAMSFVLLCGVGLWGCPQYNVYSANLSGQAVLAEAESSRKVAIESAKAQEEAAKHLAAAEIERARGVAEANKIIGSSLEGNEAYLRWLFIDRLDNVEKAGGEVIYIPTEAGMPILEAGRRQRSVAPVEQPQD